MAMSDLPDVRAALSDREFTVGHHACPCFSSSCACLALKLLNFTLTDALFTLTDTIVSVIHGASFYMLKRLAQNKYTDTLYANGQVQLKREMVVGPAR
jgi:hypothetical protein